MARRNPDEQAEISVYLRTLVRGLVEAPPSEVEVERAVRALCRSVVDAQASAPAAANWYASRWFGAYTGAILDDETGLLAVSTETLRKALEENTRRATSVPLIDWPFGVVAEEE